LVQSDVPYVDIKTLATTLIWNHNLTKTTCSASSSNSGISLLPELNGSEHHTDQPGRKAIRLHGQAIARQQKKCRSISVPELYQAVVVNIATLGKQAELKTDRSNWRKAFHRISQDVRAERVG
jgi:hypothetical protein